MVSSTSLWSSADQISKIRSFPLLLVQAVAYSDSMERVEQAFEREEESYLNAKQA